MSAKGPNTLRLVDHAIEALNQYRDNPNTDPVNRPGIEALDSAFSKMKTMNVDLTTQRTILLSMLDDHNSPIRKISLQIKSAILEQEAHEFREKISQASNITELLSIIKSTDMPILSSDMKTEIDKTILIDRVDSILKNFSSMQSVNELGGRSPEFEGSHITSNYNIREKFIQLTKELFLERYNSFYLEVRIKEAKNISEIIQFVEDFHGELKSQSGGIIVKKNLLNILTVINTLPNPAPGLYEQISRSFALRDSVTKLKPVSPEPLKPSRSAYIPSQLSPGSGLPHQKNERDASQHSEAWAPTKPKPRS